MKIKISKDDLKSLGKSIYKNKSLFDLIKCSFLIPLFIIILCIFMMSVPTYLRQKSISKNSLVSNYPGIDEALGEIFTRGIDCKISNKKLSCNEDSINEQITTSEGIIYTIVINQPINTIGNTEVTMQQSSTDNYIIFYNSQISIRYSEKLLVSKTINEYKIIGDYSKVDGFDFKEIAQKLSSDPSLVKQEVTDFVYNAYQSTLSYNLIANLVLSIVEFFCFWIVAALAFKATYLLKKKGLRLTECLKISSIVTLPGLILGSLLSLVGIDFIFVFSLIYFVRTFYIYFKYFFSKNSTLYKDLYDKYKEERYNV